MVKKSFAILLCLITAISLSACGSGGSEQAGSGAGNAGKTDDKIRVSVTFNAMREFVQAVGKDKVEISTIIPDGIEPHEFEPKVQDLADLTVAQIFVYNGLGMEAWADDAVKAAQNKNLIIVEASKGIDPIKNTDQAEINEHGQYDPHGWISLKNAIIEAGNIKDALVKADPQNKDYYESNYKDFTGKLEALFQEYNYKFQKVSKKNFVTGHAAFGYLCRDFGLVQNSVEDVFAEGEPSARQLSELADYCRKNGVTTIFAEEMASPEVSQTLAQEVGAEVKIIYTIESDEKGGTYLDRMESNLNEIYDSLKN